MKRVMTQFTAGEVRRMRAEVNEWGEPKWTGVEIAVALGVSESTIWRVLNKQAAYEKMGRVEPGGLTMEAAAAAAANSPGAGLEKKVAASLARLQGMLGGAGERASPPKQSFMSPEAQARYELMRSPLDE